MLKDEVKHDQLLDPYILFLAKVSMYINDAVCKQMIKFCYNDVLCLLFILLIKYTSLFI